MKLILPLFASLWAGVSATGCEMKYLDFSTFSAGEKVHPGGFKEKGYNLEIAVVGNGNCAQHGKPVIFDTNTATCGDTDLAMAESGNAIIIQEDPWISSCVPNDCRTGGLVKFDFDKKVILKKIMLADNDDASQTEIWYEKGNGEIVHLPKIPRGTDGDVYTQLFDEDATNVQKLRVEFKGSGGIPLLVYQECSGSGFGDPHFRTHSGHKFDYHGECDLVLNKAPSFDNGKGLDLHVRTTQQDWYSHISGAALRIGKNILEVDHESLYLNGKSTKFDELTAGSPLSFAGYPMTYDDSPVILPDSQERKRKVITVVTGKEEAIQVTVFGAFLRVSTLNPEKANFADASGLTGHYHSGLMLSRDETRVISDPEEFGQEWQVSNEDPMLFQDARAPQWPQKCITAPPVDEGRKLRSGISQKQAEDACAVLGDDIEDCVFDVLSTGDLTIVGAHM